MDSNEEKQTNELWKDYQNGLAYQGAIALSDNLPKFVKFYEGDQWAKPTKNTKNLPRPVINIIKMICRNKKSGIISVPTRIVYYASDRDEVEVELFNEFSDYIQKEIGQVEKDKDAMQDGVVKGTYIYHYYWDADAQGKDGNIEGAMRCEILDPLNVFFANPCEQDEQKQKWILIASREDVESVKAKCDEGFDKELIIGDEADSNPYGVQEQDGNKLCTVLTRYFRINGEVYWERAVKGTIINNPRPLAPDMEKAKQAFEDAPNNSLPDSEDGKKLITKRTKAPLYPIVVGNYERREGSIFGLGEVEGLIPNQKSINFNFAMALLNCQEVAWGKYIVLPNALRGQSITNEAGQVLVDYSNTGNGIKRMTEQAIQTAPINIIETLANMTRSVTGSSEVMTGETVGANMSGAAIAQLQSQAQMPIEDLRDAFWNAKVKQGKIMAQFFKLFYYQKQFTYTKALEGGADETETMTAYFSGNDYIDTDFDVVVEATSGTHSSAAGDIQMLDTLLGKGYIDVMTYFRAYPKDALTNKSEILKGLQESENRQVKQLEARLQEAEQQLVQSAELIKKQSETVNNVMPVIQENNRLRAMLAQLFNEAKTKITMANQAIAQEQQRAAVATQDATDFANMIADGIERVQQKNTQGIAEKSK